MPGIVFGLENIQMNKMVVLQRIHSLVEWEQGELIVNHHNECS